MVILSSRCFRRVRGQIMERLDQLGAGMLVVEVHDAVPLLPRIADARTR